MADDNNQAGRGKAPIFDGAVDSYYDWNFRFELYAQAAGTWDHYVEDLQRPAAAGDAQRRFDQLRTRAYTDLALALPPELINMLRPFAAQRARPGPPAVAAVAARPNAAWEHLERHFTRNQPSSRLALEQELFSLQQKQEESIAKYWARADQLLTRYERAGGLLSDALWMEKVLRGLPPHWEEYRKVLSRQLRAAQLTKDQLQVELVDEETRQKDQATLPSYQGEAQYAGGGRGRPQGGKGGSWQSKGQQQQGKGPKPKILGVDGEWGKLGPAPSGFCHGCHKEGHRLQECNRRPSPDAYPDFMVERGKGQKQQQGRHKKFGGGRKGGRAHLAAGSDNADNEDQRSQPSYRQGDAVMVQAICSFSAGSVGRITLDSGATHNFSPYKSDFWGPLEPPLADTVRVGSGAVLPVLGMGKVVVQGADGQRMHLTKVHYVPGLHTRLLSVPHLNAEGCDVLHTADGQATVMRGDKVLMTGSRPDGDHSLIQMHLDILDINGPETKVLAQQHHRAQRQQQQPTALVSSGLLSSAPGSFPPAVQPGGSTGGALIPDAAQPATPRTVTWAATGEQEARAELSKLELAHQRMGHVAPSNLLKLAAHGAATGLGLTGKEGLHTTSCEACMLGKQHQQGFPQAADHVATAPLDLVHMDLCGPFRVPTLGGKYTYTLSLLDDFSCYVWVLFLKTKAAAAVQAVLEVWLVKVERQANKKLIAMRHDGGSEFKGEVQQWLEKLGVTLQLSAPYCPQQNGRVERWHRTLVEGIRTNLLFAGLPASLWGEAANWVVWCKNRVSHSALPVGETPYERWHKAKPNLERARPFGVMGSVLLPAPVLQNQGKLGSKGTMSVCVGVDSAIKGWRMLDPTSLLVHVSPHVRFLETVTWKEWRSGRKGESLVLGVEDPEAILGLLPAPPTPDQEVQHGPAVNNLPLQELVPGGVPQAGVPEVQQDDVPVQGQQQRQPAQRGCRPRYDWGAALPAPEGPLRRSSRVAKLNQVTLDLLLNAVGVDEELQAYPGEYLTCLLAAAGAALPTQADPVSVEDALSRDDADLWREAIEKEMSSMAQFQVWDPELVQLPPGKQAVDSKLVFRIKRNQAGGVERYKVRFVARGFSQRPGDDYNETFSSVTKLGTVRLLLALAAIHDWELHVCDVDSAFLNAPLEEEVYLQQPKGYGDGTGRVFRLRKALYGLKQAPRAWNNELGRHLEAEGFRRAASDDALYLKFMPGGDFCFIPTWVDDLLIVAPHPEGVAQAKEMLARGFKIKDLGEVGLYLGMQVKRDRHKGVLELGLQRYVQGLAKRFTELLASARSCKTPIAPDVLFKIRNGPWSREEQQLTPPKQYMELLGSLMYAVTTCRPDIAFPVSVLAQASQKPNQLHLHAATRVLKYLVATQDFVLRYTRGGVGVKNAVSGSPVVGWTDSSWGEEADACSRAAYVFEAAGGAITWYSKKQNTMADSSCIAEYKALSIGCKEAIWLRQLLGELRQSTAPIPVWCDSTAAGSLAKNPVEHAKTKHVKMAWHVVRWALAEGDVSVKYVKTDFQTADMLTKAQDGPAFKANRDRLGLAPATLQG